MNDSYGTNKKASNSCQTLAVGQVPEKEIKRKTALDTLQHPTTLLPLNVWIISTIYLLLLSPMLGGAVVAIIFAALSGMAAMGLYLYGYSKEYPRHAQEIVDRLVEQRIKLEEAELRGLCVRLQSEFLNLASTEGEKALAGLTKAHEQLQASFAQGRATDPLSLSIISTLVDETYRGGLSVLSDVLELMKAARIQNKERLKEEIAKLEMDFGAPEDDWIGTERLKLKKEILATSKKRLAMLNRLQLYIDHLLYQVYRCELSLRTTGIELASVRASGSKTSVDSVVEALECTLNQVKEMQDQLATIDHQN